jgi:enterochelin esterase-like enzyme
MYLACGTEDDLCGASRAFADFLRAEKADYFYEDGPGKHDWFFWNEYLKRGLEYTLSHVFVKP